MNLNGPVVFELWEVSAGLETSPFARALPGAANGEGVRALDLANASEPAVQPYPVYVANNSSYSIVGLWVGRPGTRPQGEDALKLPSPIDRTCSSSCRECEAQHQYKTLHEVPCDADPFDLYLVVKRDEQFHYFPDPAKHDGLRITPTCGPNSHAFICFNRDEEAKKLAAAAGDDGGKGWAERNQRRLSLIEKKYAAGLSPAEEKELAELQDALAEQRSAVSPLPFDFLRGLEALAEADPASEP